MSHLLVRYILVTHSLLCLCIIIQVFMFIISFLLFLFFVYLFCFFFFFIFFYFFFFFFQAEDGIRDWSVTGVQTCGSSDLLRIGVFQHAVGGNEEILGTITKQLHDIAESFGLSPEERARRLQQLADNAIRQVREEQELERSEERRVGKECRSRWAADH